MHLSCISQEAFVDYVLLLCSSNQITIASLSMLEAEQQYIEYAKNGDQQAFGKLYDHYSGPIYRFIVLKVSGKQEAEDLMHEVFLNAWQKLPNFEERGFPFSSWLYKIARNKVIDYYRTKKQHVTIDDEQGAALVDQLRATDTNNDLDTTLGLEKVKEAMELLTGEQREVLTMRFVQDLNPKEIAVILNKREGTIRIIQHRAVTKLKKYFKE